MEENICFKNKKNLDQIIVFLPISDIISFSLCNKEHIKTTNNNNSKSTTY